MQPAVEIRDATAADAGAIARIYAHEVLAGTSSYEVVPPDAQEVRARLRAILTAGLPYLVAEVAGAVVGYACATAYRTRAGYRWTVEDSVYVDPHLQGQGVGTALLGQLIARCEALGYRQMIAVIGDSGNVASVVLHERLGFRIAGRYPGIGRKHGRWLEGVQMIRSLGDGMSTPPGEGPEELPPAG
jgi:phosphinothricin acetyltransferase